MAPRESLDSVSTNIDATRYMTVVCLTVLVWDHIVTFPAEYRYMWKQQRWTWTRALFFANRYWSIFAMTLPIVMYLGSISKEVCEDGLLYVGVASGIVVTGLTDAILAIRTYAIYNRSRTILIVLLALLATEIALIIAAGAQIRPLDLGPVVSKLVNFDGCSGNSQGPIAEAVAFLFYAPSLFYNLVVLLLTLYRCFIVEKENDAIPVLKRIKRTGVLYFAAVAVVNCIALGFAAQARKTPSIQIVCLPLTVAVPSIACSRLILSLRAMGDTRSRSAPTIVKVSGLSETSSSSNRIGRAWGRRDESRLASRDVEMGARATFPLGSLSLPIETATMTTMNTTGVASTTGSREDRNERGREGAETSLVVLERHHEGAEELDGASDHGNGDLEKKG
ncbi:hypothetical protein JCM10212_004462 [Sporobolomyces blumeae]